MTVCCALAVPALTVDRMGRLSSLQEELVLLLTAEHEEISVRQVKTLDFLYAFYE